MRAPGISGAGARRCGTWRTSWSRRPTASGAPRRIRSPGSAAARRRGASQGVFAIDGTPADCVYLALLHLVPRRPDLVVSGINHGYNLGSDVFYSGTVAGGGRGAPCAACRRIAMSLERRRPQDFSHAAAFAARAGGRGPGARQGRSRTRRCSTSTCPPGRSRGYQVTPRQARLPRPGGRPRRTCAGGPTTGLAGPRRTRRHARARTAAPCAPGSPRSRRWISTSRTRGSSASWSTGRWGNSCTRRSSALRVEVVDRSGVGTTPRLRAAAGAPWSTSSSSAAGSAIARVLDAMGDGAAPPLRRRQRWPTRLRRPPAAHRLRPDDLAALHGGARDRAGGAAADAIARSRSARAAATRPRCWRGSRAEVYAIEIVPALAAARAPDAGRARRPTTSPSIRSTAAAAGPSTRPTTSSSCRRARRASRRCWSPSSPTAAGW